jgi:cytoskeletal protein CcmA (bactofilin family)|tara:strand:- start:196 stop:645 length:450 start_codon:yes stop_codon:yes gene_type:complete
MFKSEKINSNTVKTNINSPELLNRIVEGTTIEGQINSKSNIRIDGFLKGTVITQGRLVLGPEGKIEGEIQCNNADIEGTLNGTINVKELLTLKNSAKLQGDISTNKLAIEPGAVFSGTCSMGGILKDIKHTDADKNEHKEISSIREQSA